MRFLCVGWVSQMYLCFWRLGRLCVYHDTKCSLKVQQHLSLKSLKAKGGGLFGVHILGVREGGRRGKKRGGGGGGGVGFSKI